MSDASDNDDMVEEFSGSTRKRVERVVTLIRKANPDPVKGEEAIGEMLDLMLDLCESNSVDDNEDDEEDDEDLDDTDEDGFIMPGDNGKDDIGD